MNSDKEKLKEIAKRIEEGATAEAIISNENSIDIYVKEGDNVDIYNISDPNILGKIVERVPELESTGSSDNENQIKGAVKATRRIFKIEDILSFLS